ncbi:hypothetical protein SELMODRAFT_427790 [Selaginella moellendorffii]|uniref:Uncharacterized protein n=1 Tax=Selaginella moellendorffii TaxID=88036 RepID=D8T0Q2_SELML|nr:hypothetical protein SELMODRAFT_427790 [Selaginella moellendorffii]
MEQSHEQQVGDDFDSEDVGCLGIPETLEACDFSSEDVDCLEALGMFEPYPDPGKLAITRESSAGKTKFSLLPLKGCIPATISSAVMLLLIMGQSCSAFPTPATWLASRSPEVHAPYKKGTIESDRDTSLVLMADPCAPGRFKLVLFRWRWPWIYDSVTDSWTERSSFHLGHRYSFNPVRDCAWEKGCGGVWYLLDRRMSMRVLCYRLVDDSWSCWRLHGAESSLKTFKPVPCRGRLLIVNDASWGGWNRRDWQLGWGSVCGGVEDQTQTWTRTAVWLRDARV